MIDLDSMGGLPLRIVVPLTMLLIVTFTELGFRYGRRRRRSPEHDTRDVASDLTTPMLGILGLMFAFTFGWSATRYDARRTARTQEAQAIARVDHLADFLPTADRLRVREILIEYIDLSLAISDAESLERTFRRREQLLDELWRIAANAAEADPQSTLWTSLTEATNAMTDAHLSRSILVTTARIPNGIQAGLYGILALTMMMIGYQVGLTATSRSPGIAPLTLALTLVVFLIADLNRPLEGVLRVSDTPLGEVRREILGRAPLTRPR